MTSLHLLLWIIGGLLLQLTIYLSYGFWRHWLDYLALRRSALDLSIVVKALESDDEQQAAAPAWRGLRSFKVIEKQLEDAAQSICSFYLVAQDALPLPPFQPGQFLTFQLDLPMSGGGTTPLVRCYSLSDAPDPKSYRVSIKRAVPPAGSPVPPGRSSNFFHDHINVGSVLQARAPSGHFYLDRSDAPVVLMGGGIGITPMLSMLNACLSEQPGREVWLFYGVRNSLEVVMQSHLYGMAAAHSNFHLRLCFSNPLPADVADRDYQHHGRIDVELLRGQLPLKPYHFYICGPTAMLQSLVPGLEDWGVPDARIHYEAFGPASIQRKKSPARGFAAEPDESSAVHLDVTFTRSGKQLPWQSAAGTLLEFAEAQGIAVDSGCRAGGCGTCQTTILAGEVAYRQTPDFDPEPGTCLLCVCTPKTPVTLEL
jgi:ferredoxin-NADP reductase